MTYYVSSKVKVSGDGSLKHPFKSIQEAANIALPGDEVIVQPGLYREHVNPINSGTKESPIVYRSEKLHEAIIVGSEEVKGWVKYKNNTWLIEIPNNYFGNYNPFNTVIFGDWFSSDRNLHTGEVYLNQKEMYEADNLDQVLEEVVFNNNQDTLYKWYTTQKDDQTLIYANFQNYNPNQETVEINKRRTVFQPNETNVNYIHVKGFVMRQAAPNWAPPTAFQDGLLSPNWSKGWLMEDLEISNSKCVGITLGKYYQPNNNNKWSLNRLKHGTQTERETICQAQLEGWNKENIGSHVVRRCHIHHCGQAGIVGHLGCVFSIIEDNHIHNISYKYELEGAEIAGIKLHAPIDTIIRRNHVHNCIRGIWLDWQAQGTRVSQNLLHDNTDPMGYPLFNGEDFFIEVSHGPTLIDNNIFLSPQAARISAQGVAFVHNLIYGSLTSVGTGTDNFGFAEVLNLNPDSAKKNLETARYTPYHVPHETYIAGFMTFVHGDARFYNNIFMQNKEADKLTKEYTKQIGVEQMKNLNLIAGLFPYDGYPNKEEFLAKFSKSGDFGRHESRDKYYEPLPVTAQGNIYFNGARPWEKETDFIVVDEKVELDLIKKDGKLVLKTNLGKHLNKVKTTLIDTTILEEAFHPEQLFENPDGSKILFDQDFFGERRGLSPTTGPIEKIEDLEKTLF